MPRAAPFVQSFNAGELSPRMAGRVGSEVYAAGCHVLENFLPDIAGPAIKRGGTQYIGATKTAANRTWQVAFELDAENAYVIEFGDGYLRFFKARAPVLVSGVSAWATTTAYTVGDLVSNGVTNYYCRTAHTSGTFATDLAASKWYALTGAIYEIPTPYAIDDLTDSDGAFALDLVQSGDIIYLANRGYAPRKLSRYADTLWTLTDYAPTGGPFQDVNAGTTTVYASANTGTVTLTASASIFTAPMVGTLFYLEQKTVCDTTQWEPGKAIVAADKRRSGGRNYQAVNSATTGTSTPTHTEGAVFDGDTGVQWTFLDAGYGWAQITAASGTTATATVVSRLPDGAVGSGNASTKWAASAWNSDLGYPEAIGFYLDRLCFGRDATVWMSVGGDYENMQLRDAGRQLTDSAIIIPIPSRRGTRIQWMKALESGLVVGTGSDEWMIAPASRNEPLGPLNVSANRLGNIGSRSVPALDLFNAIVFCQRSGKRLRAVRYVQGDGAAYADLNAYADHVTSGFRSIAYVAEPHSMIFGVGKNGDLCAATYYPEQNVLGWTRLPISGEVECVCAIPAPDGTSDELWLQVKRTINGATVRYHEIMRAPLPDDGDQADAFYVDSGATYDGIPTTTITGLDHLEGETVSVLVDGATHPQRTVRGGAVTMQISGSVVHVGMPYTARVAAMDIEAGSANGTAQGKVKRIWRLGVRLLRTLGGRFGTSETKLDTIQYRDASVPMGSPPPLFTGDKTGSAPGGSARSARPWFVHDDPLPATVVAFMPLIETEDA